MKKIDVDITKAATLQREFYASKDNFNNTLEKIFSRNWQFITDDYQLKENRSSFPFQFLGDLLPEPLVFINNKGTINCFSNVCTHRGNILINEPCTINKLITCGYHGKQFDTCGKFKFMPKTERMQNFPSRQDDLPEVAVAKWRQFIFSSLDPAIEFNKLIKDVEERVGWMPIEDFKYREDLSKDYYVKASWALYCDNYLEGFHIPFVHADLNAVLDFNSYDVETFKYSNLQLGIASDDDICFDLPIESKDYGRKIAAYYFWLFPNLMLNFYPWGLSVNIITPISVNETKVQFKSYVWDESRLDSGVGADLDKVELEDEQIVQQVQKGVASRFYKQGRFSPTMEKGVHHFHSLISDFMNK
ncbi:MAG: aromatic ring-hydroxylating dioxygenase subunit alpha [Flavobacteriales bacterium]|jgi:choline monooxygenase|nr:aromatic ring-hydroxylating dioxygenase subunit alpha [Flavobacteriales bacterium]MBT5750600.1 aromatic ring-hydroxylating dioxygenase subunit alpha [Flavobacteriales bacterium]